jgi:hypothetical protein
VRINFNIAKPEFEAKKLFGYIRNFTRNFRDNMFTRLEISINKDFYEKLRRVEFWEVKEELIKIIKAASENNKRVKENLPKIRIQWKKVEKRLFETIKEVTGHKVDGNFICRFLTRYKSGGYDTKTKNLWIYSSGNKKHFWGLTHELLHIHCWSIWNNLFEEYELDEARKFSEVYVELLLRDTKISFILPKEERILKFWKEVESLAKKVLPIWRNRKDFDSFLINSFKKLKFKGKLKNCKNNPI